MSRAPSATPSGTPARQSRASSVSSVGAGDPLAPDFKPAHYLVPQLRSLLLEHNIKVPSSARKPALIDAYEEHIRPRAAQLRHARDLAAAAAADADSSFDSRDSPSFGIKASARRDEGSTTPSLRRPSGLSARSPARSVSFSIPDGTESEDDSDATGSDESDAQRDDASVSQKSFNLKSPSPEVPKRRGRQSMPGPSRTSASSAAKASKPRGSTGGLPKSATTSRIAPSTSSRLREWAPTIKQEAGSEASELDHDPRYRILATHLAPPPSPAGAPRRVPKSAAVTKRSESEQPAGPGLMHHVRRGALATAAGLVALWWLWFVHDSYTLGYCDTGLRTNAIMAARAQSRSPNVPLLSDGSASIFDDEGEPEVQLLPDFLHAACAKCPPHAHCFSGKLSHCTTNDYVLSHPLISYLPLSSLYLPLRTTRVYCAPDTGKAKLASQVGSQANAALRQWRGEVMCGDHAPHAAVKGRSGAGLPAAVPATDVRFALPESRLRADLERRIRSSSALPRHADEAYLSSLWLQAMAPYEDSGAVLRIAAGKGDAVTLLGSAAASTEDLLLARSASISLGCQAKLAAHGAWKAIRFWLSILGLILTAVAYVRWRLRQAFAEKAKVRELVGAALERLQEQEYANAVDPVVTPDPFLPTAQLRDHVLQAEHSPAARQRLWEKVAKVVEGNANVRTRQAKSRGEWLHVWEWIGVAAGGSLSRRQSFADLSRLQQSEFQSTPSKLSHARSVADLQGDSSALLDSPATQAQDSPVGHKSEP